MHYIMATVLIPSAILMPKQTKGREKKRRTEFCIDSNNYLWQSCPTLQSLAQTESKFDSFLMLQTGKECKRKQCT